MNNAENLDMSVERSLDETEKDDTITDPNRLQQTESEITKNNESSPPRLIITKMILENFKSYAGIKEIGPFHKCFSCVVGPNGSGKSNVIDAMLFVFGKRAKKLRLNKVSELIHSSDAYKDSPLQYARVSVYFQEILDTGDGQEDYVVVPNTEIVVTRVAKRDNSSNYKLNDKSCSFKDVATYLESKGIDLDNNRFLILQGEVEMISMMPPKGKADNDSDGGLLEYLEDIIGSNVYVERTNEAASKVEKLTELRQEKLNRVKAVEKEKDGLEAAKLEAEALLKKQGEIRHKKNILYQLNMLRVRREIEETSIKNDQVKEQLQEERSKNQAADSRMKTIEELLISKQAAHDSSHAELVRTKEEFATFERKDVSLREDIKYAKEQKKKLESKVLLETKKEEDSESKANAAEENIPHLEGLIEDLTKAKELEDEKLELIFENMKGKTEKLREELELKTLELSPVSQERAVFQVSLDTALTEVKLLEDMTNRAKEQLSSAERELASVDQIQDMKRSELSKCEDELIHSKQRLIDAEKEDEVLAKEEEILAKQSSELMVKAEEAKASLQAMSGMNKAVSSILKAAAPKGELANAGILGRLGDLAVIDSKYDVAISTSCGMLDHIVVHTTGGAQRCLDFLRRNNLGRASFIPLDKAPKGAHDRIVETPEGAPRLFDLVSPQNVSATPALFLGIGNTLVAPDLETATRWAFDFSKRWRVVTLDGNLIESSGTMQGGGNTVKRGGMRLNNGHVRSEESNATLSLQSQEDCDTLDKQAKRVHDSLNDCGRKRSALAEEMRELNKRIKHLSVKIPKLGLEISSCDTTRVELTKRIPELQDQCVLSRSDEDKLSELNRKVSKCKSDMASCAMKASKLEADVARIQKAIIDAGGSLVKNQQEACEKALTTLNNAIKELNGSKVTISSSRKATEKAKNNRILAEKDLAKCDESLDQLKDELNSLEKEAMAVMVAYEKVKQIELEKRDELNSLQEEYDDLKKAHAKVKCVEMELISKQEQYSKSLKEFDKDIHLWEMEISKLNEDHLADSEFALLDEDDENDDKEMGSQSSGKLPVFNKTSLSHYVIDDVKRDISVLEKERDIISKNANMGAIAEYRKKEEDYLARVGELDEVTELRNQARKEHEELRRLRLEKFMEGFGQITLKLKEMYQMITLGGDAELELVDSLDPFSEGIVFSVRPPKKSWKNISNLSGGEKTLSSLALVFALHHYKPTPLYVMDEIDAALDFKNVSIVANYIKDRTKNAQFIIISLRNNMFELADRLVGIYKTNNCTKSVTIDPKAFCDVIPQKPLPLGDSTNMNGASNKSLSCH